MAVKVKKSHLERVILTRENNLKRLERKKADIRRYAEEECAAIDKLIASRKVLLEALKSGVLKP